MNMLLHMQSDVGEPSSSVAQVKNEEEPKAKTAEAGEPVETGSAEVTESELIYHSTEIQKHLLRGMTANNSFLSFPYFNLFFSSMVQLIINHIWKVRMEKPTEN